MNYEMKTLGTVATYINGRAFKPAEWESDGLPILRIQNLTDVRAKFHYSSTEYEEKYRVKNGDLLFAWSASLGAHIWHGDDAWLNQHIFRVVPNDNMDKMYLYYFLCRIVSELYSKTHGSGMVHITKGPFMETKIPVPPLDAQKRIVARIEELFSQLDSAVETLKIVKRQLAVYRQAVLKFAFSDIAPDKYKPLRSVFLGSPQNGLYKAKTAYGSGTRILRIDGFYDGRILDDYEFKRLELSESEIEQYRLNKWDLVVNRVNSMPYLGKCALVRDLAEVTVYESNMMRVRLDSTKVDPDYVTCYLSSFMGRKELAKNAKQAVNQASINQTDVGNALIPIPENLEHQRNIVSAINARMSVCENIEKTVDFALQQAKAMRQNILKQAFEGKL